MTIDSETSPTLEAVAQPDGYVEATENVSPVRRWVSGAWRDLDLTLKVAADGTVRPGLAMGDLAISNGGPAGSMIASYSSDGFSYAVKSPFALPEPTLLNDSAVFTDVIPGVDLVVRAHEVGYSYDWVVKTAEAAADPRVTELTVPVDAPGLSPHPRDGGIWYDDAGGVHRAWMPAPMMWDSSGADSGESSSPAPSSAQLSKSAAGATALSSSGADSGPEDSVAAVEAGPAGGQSATVGVTATAHDLHLVPDAGLLADAELPVVIDPEEVGYQNPSASLDGWTAVWDNYPTKSFWKTLNRPGVSGGPVWWLSRSA